MAASSGAEAGDEGNVFEIQKWRFLTLFLVIISIDFVWEVVDKLVTRGLSATTSTGLLHAWEHLKFETCALGLVSLLLAVFQVLSKDSGIWYAFS
jgi:Mlo family